ncbi:MAG TPA: hypothetical protein VL461_08100 [Dictyobacter sp.]|nr:hypothetical protein [Dictyobacter sp.]
MKKAEQKRKTLLANLGDLNRPLRVRPVRYLGREWWAIDAEDTWPGMVMDLRRLGFEAVAMEDEVLVRESSPAPEPQMAGPNAPDGLKPFPIVHSTIQIRTESSLREYASYDSYDEDDAFDDDDYVDEDEELWDPEDLDEREELESF